MQTERESRSMAKGCLRSTFRRSRPPTFRSGIRDYGTRNPIVQTHGAMQQLLFPEVLTLSQDEMRHSLMLHQEVVRVIEEYRKAHGDPPPAMQALYDYLHELSIEKSETVKRYQAMYKE